LDTILSIDNLSKTYGRIRAVDNLSIEVMRGQVFGILGPNGSGKTTTLSIILDLLKADKGSFYWFGHPSSPASRKRIGSVIESPNFYPYLTAFNNLRIIAQIRDLGENDIDRVLQLTGLYERRHSRFKTYSFGMKQRLAIASALLGHPEVLILDEPTNGLDPHGIADIRSLIQRVASEGTTIILASHLLDEVQKVCTHVAVLKTGQKLFDGKVSDVLAVSDSYELSAQNPDALAVVLNGFPGIESQTRQGSIIQVYLKEPVDASGLNQFCFERGIILSHLTERKRSLEQHFLELLDETNDETAQH
jgi:ABC-2 type transport system ATP-binding protein